MGDDRETLLSFASHGKRSIPISRSLGRPEEDGSMRFEFVTAEYEFSHGKPRGRGSWAFSLDRDTPATAMYFTPGCTTYTEAKALAKAHFSKVVPADAVGDVRIWVQP
jgi:hypothetical protein